MRILLHDYGGYAFTLQLARQLAGRGHEVCYLFSESTQLVQRSQAPAGLPNLRARGLRLAKPFRKYSFVQRRQSEIEHGRLAAAEIAAFQPAVVLSANAPLDAQRLIQRASQQAGAAFVFWLQDAISLAARPALRKKLYLAGEVIAAYYQWVERRLLRESRRVLLISRDFRPLMDAWGVDSGRVSVIPNWAPLDEITPQPQENPWARANGLAGKFCFLYSGILGLKHDPALFVQLAQHLQDQPEARVVVVSQGGGADWLQGQKSALGLPNLILLPFQPAEVYPQVLGAAGALVSILNAEAGSFSVPSKVLTYLCAGRPLLLSVPTGNLAARTALQACAGLVAPPEDPGRFLQNAMTLYADAEMRWAMGAHARAYAIEHFNIERITDQFEALIRSAVP